MTTDAASLGETLRSLRKARRKTLAALACEVGTSESHLSRIETGKRPDIGRDLIARLAKALDAEAELARAAGRLPSEQEAKVAAFAGILGDGYTRLTEPALRRLDAVPTGEALFNRTPNATRGGQVDARVLCRFRRCDPRPRPSRQSAGRPVTFANPHPQSRVPALVFIDPGSGAESATRQRFFEAHAAAHLDAGVYECTLPLLGDPSEVRLIDVACAALAPRALLDRAFRVAVAGRDPDEDGDPWGTSGVTLVEDVATSLGIPAWIAVRRLAEEGLLEDQALYESMPGSAA